MSSLPAIAIEGAKAVGKTATASERAATVHELDDPDRRALAEADPGRLLAAPPPVLIDEWQFVRRCGTGFVAPWIGTDLRGSSCLPPLLRL